MRTLARWEPFRGATSLQDHVNRLFNDDFERRGEESSLTAWAPAVDIYETEHELVVKADLPEIDPKDLDIRVENNILTIRGERKFEKKVNEDNLRSQLHPGEHREFGCHQGRLPKRRADAEHPEARRGQAEADQGQRRGSSDGRVRLRQVMLVERHTRAVNYGAGRSASPSF